jgi:hypothetical protein
MNPAPFRFTPGYFPDPASQIPNQYPIPGLEVFAGELIEVPGQSTRK